MTPEAQALLESQRWPGNVRELRNLLERAALLAEGSEITAQDVKRAMGGGPGTGFRQSAPPSAEEAVPMALSDVENRYIAQVLREAHGNKAEAARRLGISRRALYRRLGPAGHG